MVPTLQVGDHIIVDKWAFKDKSPERGDLVVFRFPKNRDLDFIKRSVAIEGDLIEIRNKVLYINGDDVDEPYTVFIDDNILPTRDNFGPFPVPEGQIFTLGDNRDNANDSRFWGPVDVDDVIGKARIIYWSWDKDIKAVRWDRIGRKFE